MPSSSAVVAAPSPRPTKILSWLLIVLAIGIPAFALFGESIINVVSKYKKPEFSHGYIIPFVSGWIIWQRRHIIMQSRTSGDMRGLFFIAVGLFIALFAHAGNMSSLPYLGLIPFIFGLVIVFLGMPAAKYTAIPIGFLAFGFYIPSTAYVLISTNLQLVSSQIGAAVLELMNVPVYLDGNIIDLGSYKLQVAEACSGLRYLLPLITFGVICAYLYKAPIWARLLVVLATVPITIAFNGARIAMTGLLVNSGNQALAEGFMHLFEGWVVFLLALACLLGLMWLLLCLTGRPSSGWDMLDFDRIAGGAPPAERAHQAPSMPQSPSRPLVFTAGAAVVAALLLVPLALRPEYIPARPGLWTFPTTIDSWRGNPQFIDSVTEDVLGSDDYLLVDFTDEQTGAETNLWIAYYGSFMREGSKAHLPTTCLPGAGWEYVELGRYTPGIKDLSGEPLHVQRGLVVHGTQRIVMYFWLELRGQHAFGQEARLMNIRDSLTHGRSDGALVRVYTTLSPDETPQDGDARLERFLETVYPHFEPHVGA